MITKLSKVKGILNKGLKLLTFLLIIMMGAELVISLTNTYLIGFKDEGGEK